MTILGKTLKDRYRVEKQLGVGRFASVYAALDEAEERMVALKVFHEMLAKRAGKRKALRLAAASSIIIDHPAVVPIIDRGQVGGVPFLVMELLVGRNVETEVLDIGPLKLERCVSIGTVMVEALAAAHDEGIVHRDLNPANVFLLDDGSPAPLVRILDFGVAEDLVDHLAVSPEVVGSTRYLAPEFLLSPVKAWTPAVDVFAAGMVLFLMLTGRLPFDPDEEKDGGDAMEKTILLYQSIGTLPGPAVLSPHVPKPIDEVVSKALCLEPEGRYRDATELLEAFVEAKPSISAKPYVPPSSSETAESERPWTTPEGRSEPPSKEPVAAPTVRMNVTDTPAPAADGDRTARISAEMVDRARDGLSESDLSRGDAAPDSSSSVDILRTEPIEPSFDDIKTDRVPIEPAPVGGIVADDTQLIIELPEDPLQKTLPLEEGLEQPTTERVPVVPVATGGSDDDTILQLSDNPVDPAIEASSHIDEAGEGRPTGTWTASRSGEEDGAPPTIDDSSGVPLTAQMAFDAVDSEKGSPSTLPPTARHVVEDLDPPTQRSTEASSPNVRVSAGNRSDVSDTAESERLSVTLPLESEVPPPAAETLWTPPVKLMVLAVGVVMFLMGFLAGLAVWLWSMR